MSEKKDYQILRKNIIEKNDRIDRIENIVVVGMPDVNVCFDGVESWIELKSSVEPKRATTPLFGSNHNLSIDQKNWFLRQRNASGNGYVLIATDLRWLLIEGKHADDVNELTVAKLVEIALWHELKPIRDKLKWKILRSLLARKRL